MNEVKTYQLTRKEILTAVLDYIREKTEEDFGDCFVNMKRINENGDHIITVTMER